MKKIILLLVIFTYTFLSSQEKKQNDVQKILSGIIKEEKIKPNQGYLYIIRFSHFPDKKFILADIVYFDKQMYFGWNENDRSWGIYNFNGFEVFIISEKTIDISNSLKSFKKISSENLRDENVKFQNEKGLDWNYDPKNWKFYVDENLKFVKPFFLSSPKISRMEWRQYKKLLKNK